MSPPRGTGQVISAGSGGSVCPSHGMVGFCHPAWSGLCPFCQDDSHPDFCPAQLSAARGEFRSPIQVGSDSCLRPQQAAIVGLSSFLIRAASPQQRQKGKGKCQFLLQLHKGTVTGEKHAWVKQMVTFAHMHDLRKFWNSTHLSGLSPPNDIGTGPCDHPLSTSHRHRTTENNLVKT